MYNLKRKQCKQKNTLLMVNQRVSFKEYDETRVKNSKQDFKNENGSGWMSKLRNRILEAVFSEDLK